MYNAYPKGPQTMGCSPSISSQIIPEVSYGNKVEPSYFSKPTVNYPTPAYVQSLSHEMGNYPAAHSSYVQMGSSPNSQTVPGMGLEMPNNIAFPSGTQSSTFTQVNELDKTHNFQGMGYQSSSQSYLQPSYETSIYPGHQSSVSYRPSSPALTSGASYGQSSNVNFQGGINQYNRQTYPDEHPSKTNNHRIYQGPSQIVISDVIEVPVTEQAMIVKKVPVVKKTILLADEEEDSSSEESLD